MVERGGLLLPRPISIASQNARRRVFIERCQKIVILGALHREQRSARVDRSLDVVDRYFQVVQFDQKLGWALPFNALNVEAF